MSEYRSMNEVNYILRKKCATLNNPKLSITKDVTLGEWKGELRLDIRKWEDGMKIGKGISLTEEEVRKLRKVLAEIDFGR